MKQVEYTIEGKLLFDADSNIDVDDFLDKLQEIVEKMKEVKITDVNVINIEDC